MPFTAPDPGELSTSVALVARTQTPTAGGGLADSYTTIASTRARMVTLFGSRLIEGVQTSERVTHVFTMRARSDNAGWRYLVARDRLYRVHSVLMQGLRFEWQEVMAEELGDAD